MERACITMITQKKLDDYIYNLNDSEKRYLKEQTLSTAYSAMNYKMINNQKAYIFDGYIPINEEFSVQRHNRFAPVPTHIHNFIEINYIFNGECTQIIDGREIILKKGQVCLIDTDVPHSINKTSERDIIINILVNKDYFRNTLLSNSLESGIITNFILNAISETASHKQYIIFKNDDFSQLHYTISDILMESYTSDIGSKQAIRHYISIFFIKLLRIFEYESNDQTTRQNQEILEIIKYLETNYEELSLAALARKFNYSPNYLSTLLKQKIGKNYSEIILEKKLNRAHTLLKNSDMTINEIALEVGFSNLTFFYTKYKERFHQLPSKVKQSTSV